jgi:activator of HSP90 ATPase
MSKEFEVTTIIDAPAQDIFNAWLNSEQHSAMTGGSANVSAEIGETFIAWDGYIKGTNLDLQPGIRILQSWRTVEFSDNEPDSQIEVLFEPLGEKTKITLKHTHLPPHGDKYEQGWIEAYFEPIKEYFAERKVDN